MTVPDRSSPMPVEAVCLTKSLGRGDSRVPVLRGLDLDVGAGEVVALLGPATTGGIARQAASDVNVFFVVDTTTSAMARDHVDGATRLDGYRDDIAKIQKEMPGARFSIITFDYTARVTMPLTTDTQALRTATDNLRAEDSLYSGGSSVTEANERLRTTLEGVKERQPERARIVFYLGDGEQTSSEPGTPFDVADLVDGGAVLGYGTEEGGRMATTNADGSTGDDVTDASGNPGVSKIDEAKLEEARRHSAAVLDEARNRLSGTVDVSSVVVLGDTVEDAVNGLDWHPGDLIMVCSSRLAAPRRLFLGSTAAKMLRVLDVPMVVVPRAGLA